jgi:hypothetical protein
MSNRIWLIPIELLVLWWLLQVGLVIASLIALSVLRPVGVGAAIPPVAILMWQGNKLRRWLLRLLRGEI